MNKLLFKHNEAVLLLGEGNFSFAAALHRLKLKINLTATCYEPHVSSNVGKQNIEYLENNGIRVFFDVDATKLNCHTVLKFETFDKIIFNFPHVGGKMKINKNRELLMKFFIAVKSILKHNGELLVALCNGQGGTPLDNPIRKWNDSWKVVEMAAHGNFMLRTVEPFSLSLFPNYTVTGYRGLNKQFYTEGALIHVFMKATEPTINNIAPDSKIDTDKLNMTICTWQEILSLCKTPLKQTDTLFMHSASFTFDITLYINSNFSMLKLFETLYNNAACIVYDVKYVDSYTFPCTLKQSQTFRITYKSNFIPLHRAKVITIHQDWIGDILERTLNVTVCK